MSDIKKNQIITLDIADMNNLGYGVGRHAGIVVFVRGAVTGDTVECKIIKVNKSYLVARLERVLSPSPHRADKPFCLAPESCGGCIYRNVDYSFELAQKRNDVINAFRRAGLFEVSVCEVLSTGVTEGYRNKAQYPVAQNKDGSLYAGFYATGTHRIAGSGNHSCSLQPAVFDQIVKEICAEATKLKIDAYNETTGKGILRHIYIRRGTVTGEIMVCLVINADNLSGAEKIADKLCAKHPEIVGFLLNINEENTNVVLGERFITIKEREYIEDILCGLRFKITPDSFYQVNHDGAELLYGVVRRLALENASQKRGPLLDLYCGTGTIGLTMAKDFDELVGIEIVPAAVECARENAKINAIDNAWFYCGDASDAGGLLGTAERERGRKIENATVILDPPRSGSTPELIRYISERGFERVIYVSCAPDTLARDCALFKDLGYSIGDVTPVDMFPRTGHVECVVLMSRVKD